MLENLQQHCKEHKELLTHAKVTLLIENQYQSSDFLTIGLLLGALAQEKKVTFLAFRENYAHFLSLSKKIGKSLQSYLKSKQLTYIECFQSHFCSQLPLVEVPPATYVSPPSLIQKIHTQNLMNQQNLFEGSQVIVVDSISYIQERVDLCFWIYQQASLKNSQILLGGCSNDDQVTRIFEAEAELIIKIENDVGGYGKLSIGDNKKRSNVLWKTVNNKLEFSQQITI